MTDRLKGSHFSGIECASKCTGHWLCVSATGAAAGSMLHGDVSALYPRAAFRSACGAAVE